METLFKVIKKQVRKLQGEVSKLSAKIDQKTFGNQEFVIVSNNCWGGQIYQRLNRPYNTPFVGLYIFGPDYMKLLNRFEYYLSRPLTFTSQSLWTDEEILYPIGKLDDIEIHFVYYADKNEAIDKWTRRVIRLNKVKNRNNFFIKIDDRDQTTTEMIKEFHSLPFVNKISFGVMQMSINEHIVIPETDQKFVPNGVILYKKGFRYVDQLNWIKTGSITINLYSKIKSLAGIA